MSRRFFVREISPHSSSIRITGDEFHHLVHVVRFSIGDTIQLISSNGVAEGVIQDILHDAAIVVIKSYLPSVETSYVIHLLQGLPKIKKMDDIIEKGTEVGIRSFHPVIMKRSYSSLSAEQLKEKTNRWNRIACAATKQSGASTIPYVHDVHALRSRIQSMDVGPHDILLVADEAEKERNLFQVLPTTIPKKVPNNIWICIGPEGGITEEEMGFLGTKGFQPVTLGRTILRTETAGYFMAGLVQYIMEFL
ncbi:MAG: RsmE family RNA methyltransferase [Caldisericia bacterium]|nr:RsmE family RNA methyltransferase [Caldisericia bacterium]MDD4613959.1 RsmE family RNA methyltransferase [Caldisericia bacterium]